MPIVVPPLPSPRSAALAEAFKPRPVLVKRWATVDPAMADMVVGVDLGGNPVVPFDVALVQFKSAMTISTRSVDQITKNERILPPAVLVIGRGMIEKLSSFPEPQPNGVNLLRWEVGYWCDPKSTLANPDQGKLLLCESGLNTWVSFSPKSFSVSFRRGDEQAFIQVWGY